MAPPRMDIKGEFMRILDEHDNELNIEDLDMTKGELLPEQLLKEHHEAVEGKQPVTHYKVKTFYFTDGSQLNIEDEDDPRVEKIDAENGVFGYTGDDKEVRGIDLESVTDEEGTEAEEAWDEYEDIQRWHPLTEEEIAVREAEQERQAKQQAFLETGADKLEAIQTEVSNNEVMIQETQNTLDDIVLMMADMVNM